MKTLRWKTLGKMNVERNAHSWTIRLVGKPEYNYLQELIKFLEANKFVYKVTNSSSPREVNRHWYVDPTQKECGWLGEILNAMNTHKELGYYVHSETGEIIAAPGDTLRVCVYKNTTHLEVVDRKEVF